MRYFFFIVWPRDAAVAVVVVSFILFAVALFPSLQHLGVSDKMSVNLLVFLCHKKQISHPTRELVGTVEKPNSNKTNVCPITKALQQQQNEVSNQTTITTTTKNPAI